MTTKYALDTTTDFLTLYLHHVGRSEIPTVYHRWTALSLIAACVGDRVWLTKRKRVVTPNLYTVLIGPSGNSKGSAIHVGVELIRDLAIVNMYDGMITAPKLVDWLGTKHKNRWGDDVMSSKIYLVTKEVSLSVDTGIMANKFIRLMTQLYEGGDVLEQGTRTSGYVAVNEPCVNWIGGSTAAWLIESVPRSAIDSGFLARCVLVSADYDSDNRIANETYPGDYDEVKSWLTDQCAIYTMLQGEFTITAEAHTIRTQWYMNRPTEREDALMAAWMRDDILALKIAMLLSLSECQNLVIEARHVIAAQRLVSEAHRALPSLLDLASQTPETVSVDLVRRNVKKDRSIHHYKLLRRLSSRGVNAARLGDAVRTLIQSREITIEKSAHQGDVYVWTGGK